MQPRNGSFALTLRPGYIYSLTTTSGQHKGTARPAPARPWPLPYRENFDEYPPGETPRLFADIGGAFGTAPCAGRPGNCLQQEVTEQPVRWTSINNYPLTVVGDPESWRNYQVDVDALLQQPGYVELDGRSPATQGRSQGFFSSPPGYHFRIDDQGAWSLYKQDVRSARSTLASGTASFGVGSWHRLGLRMRGDEITVSLDGRPLATVLDGTYRAGQVALQVSPWNRAQFDNLAVQELPAVGEGPQLGAVQPTLVQLAAPGDSAPISTTVTNPGQLPATAIDAQLQAPDGWTASTVSAPPEQLPGGQSAPLSWQLTAPSSATPGRYQATITVTYTEGNLRWIASTTIPVDLSIVPHAQMTAAATSWQPGFEPNLAIDDNPATFWHTEFSPVKAVPPQSITFDLGGNYDVSGLLYLPRQDGNPNGTITGYNVYASPDGTTFTKVASGTWPDDATQKSASFTTGAVRYIRLEGVQAHNDNVSAAEINIIGTPAP
ncbi:MAG: discoidin domain-containing protein [Nocardiopsaceae bacterium]|nr:discoidin domain-containing protein [Nocardiopsaceae bacterium]